MVDALCNLCLFQAGKRASNHGLVAQLREAHELSGPLVLEGALNL